MLEILFLQTFEAAFFTAREEDTNFMRVKNRGPLQLLKFGHKRAAPLSELRFVKANSFVLDVKSSHNAEDPSELFDHLANIGSNALNKLKITITLYEMTISVDIRIE